MEDFPTVKIPDNIGLQRALGLGSKLLGLEKYKEGNLVKRIPDISMLTPFGMGKLLSHLKNSFFPSGEKEQVSESKEETYKFQLQQLHAGKENIRKKKELKQARKDLDDGKITREEFEKIRQKLYGDPKSIVATNNNSDAVIDDSGESGGEITSAKLAETNTSSASSSVSNVSSQTTYEESAAGTVILGEPSRGNFASGAVGDSQYQQAMVMYNNQKEMLNSYFKTQVAASLYKI